MKIKNGFSKYISLLLILLVLAAGITLPSFPVYADEDDVSVIMMVSEDTIRIEGTETITVSIKSKKPFSTKLYLNFSDEYFDYIDGDFTLDGRLLSIELRGDYHYISGRFRAKKAGSARFYTSCGNVLDENGLQLSIAHAGAWIDILDENGTTEKKTDEETDDPENTEEEPGVTESNVTEEEPEGDPVAEIGGKSYSFITLDDGYVPEGFKEGTAKYKGWTVPAYVSPNKIIKLVALQDEDENMYLSILDEGSNKLSAYDPVLPGTARFLIKDKPKNVQLPDGFKEDSFDFGKGAVKVYKNEDLPDVLLVYAINLDGSEGFYFYDTVEKTFIRYMEPQQKEEPVTEKPATAVPAASADSKTKDEGFFNRDNMIIISITLASLFLIMSILAIVFMTKSSKRQGTIEDLEDRLYRMGKKQKNYRYAEDDYAEPAPQVEEYYDDDYDDDEYFPEGEGYEEEPAPLADPVTGETIEIVMVDAEDNNKSVPVPPAVDKKIDRVEEAMKHRPHGIDSAFDVVDEGSEEEEAAPAARPARPAPRPLRPEYRPDSGRYEDTKKNAAAPEQRAVKNKKPQKVALPFDDEEDEG